jgi:hypothetical protein
MVCNSRTDGKGRTPIVIPKFLFRKEVDFCSKLVAKLRCSVEDALES